MTRLHHVCSPLALALFACGGSAVSTAPAQSPGDDGVTEYSARAFFETVTVFGGSFSHDEERLLITSDQTGIFNVYAQPVDGGEPVALTSSEGDAMFALSYFPEDDRFLYSSDQGGNELRHIYVMEPGEEARDLTPGDGLTARFLGWNRDETHFYVITNERDSKAFDLYRYAAKDYARELVFENPGELTVSDVSPDGRWVALRKTHNNANSDIYLWDTREDAEPVLITAHEGNVEHSVAGFSRDSASLYYSTDGHGEFTQIWSYDIGAGTHAADIVAEWDVLYMHFSKSGRYKVYATNEDARTVIRVVDTTTGEFVDLPDLPDGDIKSAGFSPSETKMMFYVSSDRSPSNLYVLDMVTGETRQLTDTLNPAIDPGDLVDGRVVRYPSFDGRDIPAILYRPRRASADHKVPALVWVHGGPGGQSRLGYRPTIQHLVNHGYAVLAVNNRGSSGYGKTFNHLDDRNHGDGDLKDCIWGRKYLETLDWVDGSRVGIIGGSYGGYMVLAALAFAPDAFDVGIDIFGVANWVRTLENIPPWWAAFRDSLYAEMGDPATDRERLERISPLFHADNIKKPLLVIQGANDPRVLKVESDEMVAAVKKNGVPVEYVVFDDEGHGFVKRDNRIAASNAFVRFLDAHL